MAVVFPTTPAPNQVVTDPVTNATWRWDAPSQRWVPAATGAIFATEDWVKAQLGPPTHVGDTAPSPPNTVGDLWMDTSQVPPVLNVYDGTNWVLSTTPPTGFLPLTGGALSGSLSVKAGSPTTGLSISATGAIASDGSMVCTETNYSNPALTGRTGAIAFGWQGAAVPLIVNSVDSGYVVRTFSDGGLVATHALQLAGGTSTMYAFYNPGLTQSVTWPITFSDRRLKSELQPTEFDALATLDALPVYSGVLTSPLPGAVPERQDCMVIADEIKEIVPAAHVPALHGGYETVRELPLIATLIRAVQQLSARVRELEGAKA